jgi:hypothetical protein
MEKLPRLVFYVDDGRVNRLSTRLQYSCSKILWVQSYSSEYPLCKPS